jgi:hypothetical protein
MLIESGFEPDLDLNASFRRLISRHCALAPPHGGIGVRPVKLGRSLFS